MRHNVRMDELLGWVRSNQLIKKAIGSSRGGVSHAIMKHGHRGSMLFTRDG